MDMIVETHDSSIEPYKWWYDFYCYVHDLSESGLYRKTEKNILDLELKKYNARYVEHRKLEFDTKEGYVTFMLKWS